MTPEEKLISLGNKTAKENFMDFPDYDPDNPITDLASALTVIISDSQDNTSDLESSEVYNFLKEKLGD